MLGLLASACARSVRATILLEVGHLQYTRRILCDMLYALRTLGNRIGNIFATRNTRLRDVPNTRCPSTLSFTSAT